MKSFICVTLMSGILVAEAAAQQSDSSKQIQLLRQARATVEYEAATCSLAYADLQAKIVDLEKQLADAKTESSKQ